MREYFRNELQKMHWWRFRLVIIVAMIAGLFVRPIIWSFIV